MAFRTFVRLSGGARRWGRAEATRYNPSPLRFDITNCSGRVPTAEGVPSTLGTAPL